MKKIVLFALLMFLGVGAFAQTKDSVSLSLFQKKKNPSWFAKTVNNFFKKDTSLSVTPSSCMLPARELYQKAWLEHIERRIQRNLANALNDDRKSYYVTNYTGFVIP